MPKYKVFVSGGSRGIGLATCKALLSAGHQVWTCARDISNLVQNKELQPFLNEGQLIVSTCDLTLSDNINNLAQDIIAKWQSIDVLVNNAGGIALGGILDNDTDALLKSLQTNLFSAYELTRALSPSMIENRKGLIINICSVASQKPFPQMAPYSISKYALLGFSDNLREELRPHHINVTSILPGATYTSSWDGVDVNPERLIDAKEIASTITYVIEMPRGTTVEQIVLRPQQGDL